MESKRENFMEQNIRTSNLANCRRVAQAYGPYFGQMLFTVVTTCPDLKWKEDCALNKQTLRKEQKAFIIKAIDINGIKFLEKDLDGYPKIVLNPESNDPNLVFNIAMPEFPKATRENVLECIDRIGKNGTRPMFFSAQDLPLLIELVRNANQTVLADYEDMSRKCARLAQTVRDMMDAADKMKSDYLRQCGVEEHSVELNVNIEASPAE